MEWKQFSVRVGGREYELVAIKYPDGRVTVGDNIIMAPLSVPEHFHERLFAMIDEWWDDFDAHWPKELGVDMDGDEAAGNGKDEWPWPS